MKQPKQIVIVLLSIFFLSCSTDEASLPAVPVSIAEIPPTEELSTPVVPENPDMPVSKTLNYLALGDSYTIGENVCVTCSYPEQLKSQLNVLYPENNVSLKVIATTGWTTTNLISAIRERKPESHYDLVTLLIGVNNQYQNKSFSIYQNEFIELVATAIKLAKGDKKNVVVLSIPDYAYTPYGNNRDQIQKEKISNEIAEYNSFAWNYCKANNIAFVNITDISKRGLSEPNLVAPDGLHPSESAYTLFVEKMLPNIKVALQE